MSSFVFYYLKKFVPWRNGFLTRLLYIGRCAKFGARFRASKIPRLTLKPGAKLIIGDDVFFGSQLDLRVYENSTLIIESKCKIDDGVRIIAANERTVHLKTQTKIGFYSVINGGGGVQIGPNSSTYGFVYIQSSNHSMNKDNNFSKNEYSHNSVFVGASVLIGTHSTILPGARIEDKEIVPSHQVIEGA